VTTRVSLAHRRGAAGHAAGAVTAFEQLLTDCLRVLGPDHPTPSYPRRPRCAGRRRDGFSDGASDQVPGEFQVDEGTNRCARLDRAHIGYPAAVGSGVRPVRADGAQRRVGLRAEVRRLA